MNKKSNQFISKYKTFNKNLNKNNSQQFEKIVSPGNNLKNNNLLNKPNNSNFKPIKTLNSYNSNFDKFDINRQKKINGINNFSIDNKYKNANRLNQSKFLDSNAKIKQNNLRSNFDLNNKVNFNNINNKNLIKNSNLKTSDLIKQKTPINNSNFQVKQIQNHNSYYKENNYSLDLKKNPKLKNNKNFFGSINKKVVAGSFLGISAIVSGATAGSGIFNFTNNSNRQLLDSTVSSAIELKNKDVETTKNRFIGNLNNSYLDKEKGIVDTSSPLLKKFDDSKVSDAYYGANGVIASKEVASKSLLPDYKLVKKYTYNDLNKLYDSVSDLEKGFWNNINETGIAFYSIKDKNGNDNYFNPINPKDVRRFKLFAVNEFLKSNDLFDIDYYIPRINDKNNSEFIGFKNSSYVFSDDGNLKLISNSNLGSAFNQKINSFFQSYVNNLLNITQLTPTISIPSSALSITNRVDTYRYDGYKTPPKFGLDNYFGIGIKNSNDQNWDDVKISNKLEFTKSFSPESVVSELSKITNKDSISNNFESIALKQRYKRGDGSEYKTYSSSLSSDVSGYNNSLIDEQDNLRDFISNAHSRFTYLNWKKEDVSKKLDQKFLKHHAHINNNSFITKDDKKLFGESIGLIYKGSLYASTNRGDSSLATDKPISNNIWNKTFIYNKTESSNDRNKSWFTGGSFDKNKFDEFSKEYFGFGEIKNANASYGNYPMTGSISNNTVQVGSDIFDMSTGRRNAKNIVDDIQKSSNWLWNSQMTFLPRYWESYRISEEDRKLFLNVDLDFKLDNKSYKLDDIETFKKDILSKFGLFFDERDKKYTINKESDFYSQYLNNAYVFGKDTYSLFNNFKSFSFINELLDQNFIKLASEKVENFIKLFQTSQKTLSLGKNNSDSFDQFKNSLLNLKKSNSSFDNSKVTFDELKSNEFLYKNVIENNLLRVVLTYGKDKQPIFELKLDNDDKNEFNNLYNRSQSDFKNSIATFISQMEIDKLDKTLINLSNKTIIETSTYRPVFKYNLANDFYFTADQKTKELKLKPEYDNTLDLIEPNLPRDDSGGQKAKFISDNRNWFPVTYLWKTYNKSLENVTSAQKEKIKDTLFSNPDDFFVLRDSVLSFKDLYYGKYFEVDNKYKNLSLDSQDEGFNLFFDSYLKRIATQAFAKSQFNISDVSKKYQIAYYYLNDQNQQLGLTIGDNSNEEELQNQAKLSALFEIKPKLVLDKKIYKNEDNTESVVDNVIFNLFEYDSDGRTLYFDSKQNLEKYKNNL